MLTLCDQIHLSMGLTFLYIYLVVAVRLHK